MVTAITFEYDAIRGGFLLRFGEAWHNDDVLWPAAFGGLISVGFRDSLISTIGSFFGDHGGVPILGLRDDPTFPSWDGPVGSVEITVGTFHLLQDRERLRLWFGAESPTPESERHDPGSGVSCWFSPTEALAGWPVPGEEKRVAIPLLAGIAVDTRRTAGQCPIDFLRLRPEDFK